MDRRTSKYLYEMERQLNALANALMALHNRREWQPEGELRLQIATALRACGRLKGETHG